MVFWAHATHYTLCVRMNAHGHTSIVKTYSGWLPVKNFSGAHALISQQGGHESGLEVSAVEVGAVSTHLCKAAAVLHTETLFQVPMGACILQYMEMGLQVQGFSCCTFIAERLDRAAESSFGVQAASARDQVPCWAALPRFVTDMGPNMRVPFLFDNVSKSRKYEACFKGRHCRKLTHM